MDYRREIPHRRRCARISDLDNGRGQNATLRQPRLRSRTDGPRQIPQSKWAASDSRAALNAAEATEPLWMKIPSASVGAQRHRAEARQVRLLSAQTLPVAQCGAAGRRK